MKRFVVIVYQGMFREFDLAQEFADEAEARAFARSKRRSAIVIVPGTLDDWFAGQTEFPVAIYCYGAEYKSSAG